MVSSERKMCLAVNIKNLCDQEIWVSLLAGQFRSSTLDSDLNLYDQLALTANQRLIRVIVFQYACTISKIYIQILKTQQFKIEFEYVGGKMIRFDCRSPDQFQ